MDEIENKLTPIYCQGCGKEIIGDFSEASRRNLKYCRNTVHECSKLYWDNFYKKRKEEDELREQQRIQEQVIIDGKIHDKYTECKRCGKKELSIDVWTEESQWSALTNDDNDGIVRCPDCTKQVDKEILYDIKNLIFKKVSDIQAEGGNIFLSLENNVMKISFKETTLLKEQEWICDMVEEGEKLTKIYFLLIQIGSFLVKDKSVYSTEELFLHSKKWLQPHDIKNKI